MLPFRFVPYEPARHEAAVLALFRSNLDPYFLPEEEADLLAHLREGEPYFVALADAADHVVAAGGCSLDRDAAGEPVAVLTWGMVRRDLHGQGLGRAFAWFRLEEAARRWPGLPVQLETSQHTAAFYARLGFRLLRTRPEGFGLNLDACLMRRDN